MIQIKDYWLQRVDLNHRPSGYEPDELPLLYSAIQEVRKLNNIRKVDGVGGFEPPHDWTKTNCLTAWLYPIKKDFNYTKTATKSQD